MPQLIQHPIANRPNIQEAVLRDGDHMLSVLNYGAVTRNWVVPVDGKPVSVILGFQNPADYLTSPYFLGTIAGRVSNRIGGARFSLNGQDHVLAANEGTNQLHGGPDALNTKFWDIEQVDDQTVQLGLQSAHGENGYPGNVTFHVKIHLNGAIVTYELQAQVDRPTPISLAQHNYYNLMGHGGIWGHQMTCVADHVLAKGPDNVSTGQIDPVAQTAFDFRQARRFDQAHPDQPSPDRGVLDGHLVFPKDRDPDAPVACFRADNGVTMRVWSDQSGAQIYNAAGMPELSGGLNGQTYPAAAGFCFEPQGHPNAVNIPSFPSVIATPEHPYRQVLEVEIKQISQ
ncbi:aldose epimerase family protein [Aestuariibius sp. HNIBRBA575]|uniref:aldose epimerase family protein n=1 Tax=Aestuariibius sp. HNIBRBA575 TaxID=3233343 RepID=UPI0034A5CD4B